MYKRVFKTAVPPAIWQTILYFIPFFFLMYGFDLYGVNLSTYQQTLLAQNPGDVVSWITDQEGDLRARVRKIQTDNWALELLHPQHQTWKALITWDFNDSVRILGFTPDDRGMWLLSNRGRDRVNLARLDLKSGKEVSIYTDPQVDVAGEVLSDLTKEPIWAFSCPDYPKIHFFDSKLETGEKNFLGEAPIAEYAGSLTTVQPVSLKSLDGLDLHGYLSLPRGTSGLRLPMVLLVHGGPWNRDWWGLLLPRIPLPAAWIFSDRRICYLCWSIFLNIGNLGCHFGTNTSAIP